MHEPSRKLSRLIDLRKLERENMRFFYLGLIIGVCLHLVVLTLIPYHSYQHFEPENEIQNIAVDIITLPPTVPNPYETWTRERTEKQFQQPQTSPVLTDMKPVIHSPASILSEIPRTTLTDSILDARDVIETRRNSLISELLIVVPDNVFSNDMTISREPGDQIPFDFRMFGLDEIDALGQYKAFVIRDLSDLQNLQGFFHIPQHFYEMDLISKDGSKAIYNLVYALNGLSEAFNYYTGMKLIVDPAATLSSEDYLDYPVIYLTSATISAFDIDARRVDIFKEYFSRGGFAIIENGRPWSQWTPVKASLLNILSKTFGDSIRFQQIPRDHPLFYCFFEFDTQIPEGAENWPPDEVWDSSSVKVVPDWGDLLHYKDLDDLRQVVESHTASLWGVWIGNRLAAIYSDKGYGHLWQQGIIGNKWWDFDAASVDKYNFNPQLKLGVNMLVYALLQEGGLAHRMTEY